jgi:phosphoribosylglycinamide formyltransferase-1
MSVNNPALPTCRIAILASGQGSNALRLVEYFGCKGNVSIGAVLSNKDDAPVLAKMSAAGIPTFGLNKQAFSGDARPVLDILEAQEITHLALAGFLLLLPENLLERYPDRVVNLHPALLPRFGGKGMYGRRVHEAAIAAGERFSGITVHEVDPRYDEGRILFQAQCPVLAGDTPETLEARVRELEHRYYPAIVEAWALACRLPRSPQRAA